MINKNEVVARVESASGIVFQANVQVLIIGAGACGLTAAWLRVITQMIFSS